MGRAGEERWERGGEDGRGEGKEGDTSHAFHGGR